MGVIVGPESFLDGMKVALGTLAQSALEAHFGPDIPAAVNRALAYYVDKLASDPDPVKFPKALLIEGRAAAEAQASGAGPAGVYDRVEVDVDFDQRVEAALRGDAARQGVSPTDLAGHAVLIYLAELDRVGDEWTLTGPHRD